MKPKPSTTLIALWSIWPSPKSLNSGYSTAPTTIIPATKQAARKANRMTKRRPIRDMAGLRHCERSDKAIHPAACWDMDCFVASLPCANASRLSRAMTGTLFSIRHRHGAQRLALARGQFFGLRLQLAAGGEDVAATRRADRRRVAGVEDIFGELFDLLPLRALILGARPRIERDQIDFRRNALEQLHQKLGVIHGVVDALEHHIFEGDAARIG